MTGQPTLADEVKISENYQSANATRTWKTTSRPMQLELGMLLTGQWAVNAAFHS
jgi:hypothetical protein